MGPSPLSTKPFWRRINRIRNKKRPSAIPDIHLDCKILETDEEKANAFADRLENIFSNENKPNFDREHMEKINKFTI